jgi:hypothetical protein
MATEILITNHKKSYPGSAEVLKGIDLEVKKRQLYALLVSCQTKFDGLNTPSG